MSAKDATGNSNKNSDKEIFIDVIIFSSKKIYFDDVVHIVFKI